MKKYIIVPFFLIAILIIPVAAEAQWSRTGLLLTGMSAGLSSATMSQILSAIIRWALYLVAGIGIIGFIASGIMYMTAYGDEDRIDRAKRILTFSIVGVVVSLIGLVVVSTIDWLLRGFNPM